MRKKAGVLSYRPMMYAIARALPVSFDKTSRSHRCIWGKYVFCWKDEATCLSPGVVPAAVPL